MNTPRLFTASRMALVVTAMSFAIRGAVAGDWAAEFHLTNEQIGWINGTAFWGFTLAMIFGGPLCDVLGVKRLVWIAFVGHLAGIFLTIFAWDYWSLFTGTLLFGIANGSVEAGCNPMVAALFPDDKTTKLNHFHVWFPGGIVIGGLVSYLLASAGIGWKLQFATMLVPLAAYGLLFFRQEYPRTERVQQGVSTGSMFISCLNPWFLLMVACMLMTAATELGPGQWIPNILTHAGVPGILVLVWINGIMAVGRQCAGTFVHRLSPPGMLLVSAVLSALGLYAMSRSSGGLLFAAATLFALGVCFFWPTMLGYANEHFPRTGALGLAIMGGAGMLSVSIVLPFIGRSFDQGIADRLPAGHGVADLSAAAAGSDLAALWARIQADAGLQTLGRVAVLPAILSVVFLFLLAARRKKIAIGAAALVPALLLVRPARAASDFREHLGLQLYSLRDQVKADPVAALDLVKGYGITEVELAGTGTRSVPEFSRLLQERGLVAVSAHYTYDRLKTDLPGIIQEARTLGISYVICPYLPKLADNFDEKAARSVAAEFNAWGSTLRAAGLRLGYHPHGYEFRPIGPDSTDTAFDVFVQNTDPESVCFEMDVFWAFHGGQDPVRLLSKYPTRWAMLHLKDIRLGAPTGGPKPQSAPPTDMVPIGTGQIDWRSVLTTAERIGIQHYFIEDETLDPLRSIPSSLKYLRDLSLK